MKVLLVCGDDSQRLLYEVILSNSLKFEVDLCEEPDDLLPQIERRSHDLFVWSYDPAYIKRPDKYFEVLDNLNSRINRPKIILATRLTDFFASPDIEADLFISEPIDIAEFKEQVKDLFSV